MKLQDAFVSESSINYGSWKMIGYTMSTTNNVFNYNDPHDGSYNDGTDALGSAETIWRAVPKANLNDCTSSAGFWTLDIEAGGTGNNGAAYTATVAGGAGGDCDVLVPGFGKLDKTGHVN